jgi:DNA-binding transcriptional MerR regulator
VPTDTYSIADLARLSGVSVRTIRYYLAQGLLPASGESGPGAHYGEDHLNRLRLTKRLQAQHLPLAEIRTQLERLSEHQIAGLVEAGAQPVREAQSSALEYVRSILQPRPPITPPAMSMAEAPAPVRSALFKRIERVPGIAEPALAEDMASASPVPERSQWERLALGPNIELHVRRPLSRIEQKRVERLITIARQVLKEDTP